jgi:hypothetical protein
MTCGYVEKISESVLSSKVFHDISFGTCTSGKDFYYVGPMVPLKLLLENKWSC